MNDDERDDDTPEPELCIYCTSEPVDLAHAPYCGTICAILAEVDSVD